MQTNRDNNLFAKSRLDHEGKPAAPSGEECFVIGRARDADAIDSYFLRYVTADGSSVENWGREPDPFG